MTEQHPITPPPELVQEWLSELYGSPTAPGESTLHVANRAAQWGADQELESCCEWFVNEGWFKYAYEAVKYEAVEELRRVRRPKPQSLKAQALEDFEILSADLVNHGVGFDGTIIRRALEALPDD